MLNECRLVTVPPDSGALTTVALAAGTSNKTSGSIDLSNAISAEITVKLGAVTPTGTGSFKLQWSEDDITYTDVTGSTQTWDDTMSNLSFAWGISEVVNKYMKVVTTRATANTAVAIMEARVYSRNVPVTQLTTGIQNAAQPVILSRSNI